jgi:hypothetical protein
MVFQEPVAENINRAGIVDWVGEPTAGRSKTEQTENLVSHIGTPSFLELFEKCEQRLCLLVVLLYSLV